MAINDVIDKLSNFLITYTDFNNFKNVNEMCEIAK